MRKLLLKEDDLALSSRYNRADEDATEILFYFSLSLSLPPLVCL